MGNIINSYHDGLVIDGVAGVGDKRSEAAINEPVAAQNNLLVSAFPMFVPSLSWQIFVFQYKMSPKRRFLTSCTHPKRIWRFATLS